MRINRKILLHIHVIKLLLSFFKFYFYIILIYYIKNIPVFPNNYENNYFYVPAKGLLIPKIFAWLSIYGSNLGSICPPKPTPPMVIALEGIALS